MMVQVNWIRGRTVQIEIFSTRRRARKAIKSKDPKKIEKTTHRFFRARRKVYNVYLALENVA